MRNDEGLGHVIQYYKIYGVYNAYILEYLKGPLRRAQTAVKATHQMMRSKNGERWGERGL